MSESTVFCTGPESHAPKNCIWRQEGEPRHFASGKDWIIEEITERLWYETRDGRLKPKNPKGEPYRDSAGRNERRSLVLTGDIPENETIHGLPVLEWLDATILDDWRWEQLYQEFPHITKSFPHLPNLEPGIPKIEAINETIQGTLREAEKAKNKQSLAAATEALNALREYLEGAPSNKIQHCIEDAFIAGIRYQQACTALEFEAELMKGQNMAAPPPAEGKDADAAKVKVLEAWTYYAEVICPQEGIERSKAKFPAFMHWLEGSDDLHGRPLPRRDKFSLELEFHEVTRTYPANSRRLKPEVKKVRELKRLKRIGGDWRPVGTVRNWVSEFSKPIEKGGWGIADKMEVQALHDYMRTWRNDARELGKPKRASPKYENWLPVSKRSKPKP